jgi:hypothetical protein
MSWKSQGVCICPPKADGKYGRHDRNNQYPYAYLAGKEPTCKQEFQMLHSSLDSDNLDALDRIISNIPLHICVESTRNENLKNIFRYNGWERTQRDHCLNTENNLNYLSNVKDLLRDELKSELLRW